MGSPITRRASPGERGGQCEAESSGHSKPGHGTDHRTEQDPVRTGGVQQKQGVGGAAKADGGKKRQAWCRLSRRHFVERELSPLSTRTHRGER